jgi:3-deoxy-D-manno-octulosonic-acid transferase
MSQFFYTFLLRLLSPLIWAWMAHRARRAGGDWQIFGAQRFGAYPQPWDGESPVWVHAVSLGETRAAQALIAGLIARGDRVLLTHTTATGRAEGARLFAVQIAAGQLVQQWMPYDFPGACRDFFQHYQPRLGILIEREIWPNLMQQAQVEQVPMILANARFSEQALGHVKTIERFFPGLMQASYASLALTLAQTQDDATRMFLASVNNIVVAGNLKFDVLLPTIAVDAGRAWRVRIKRPIVAIASTREGEDAMFVTAIQSLQNARDGWDAQSAMPDPLYLLIPRHPQRFDEAAALLENAGLRFIRWSTIRHDVHADAQVMQAQVVLCDTLGEMPFFYAASEIAIVAGSFAPLGGQNLIEACAVGTPVIVGPHTRNFADAVQGALDAGVAIQISESETSDPALRALTCAREWLMDEQALEKRSAKALQWVAQNTGAANRMLNEISEFETALARA